MSKAEQDAAGIIKQIDEMETMVVIHHAKMIEEYCKTKKCNICPFHNGTCRLVFNIPSEWNIKE